MCSPSGDTNVWNGRCSLSCQPRIRSERCRRPTCSAIATVAISDTMSSMFGLAITFGAYCGSIRTTSAPVALRRVRPSCRREACGGTALPRSTEFVPTCHSTRSGFSAVTALAGRPSMVGGFLAVDAAVQHRDLMSREMTGKFLRQPARIGGGGCARTRAEGRGGAERHDLDGLTAGEQPCHADQRHIKAHLLRGYDARR